MARSDGGLTSDTLCRREERGGPLRCSRQLEPGALNADIRQHNVCPRDSLTDAARQLQVLSRKLYLPAVANAECVPSTCSHSLPVTKTTSTERPQPLVAHGTFERMWIWHCNDAGRISALKLHVSVLKRCCTQTCKTTGFLNTRKPVFADELKIVPCSIVCCISTVSRWLQPSSP